jgi:hypothetical protein
MNFLIRNTHHRKAKKILIEDLEGFFLGGIILMSIVEES